MRCFVLGNGPSLIKHDLTKLEHEVTFGCNRIYLLREQMGFPVTYYFCVDSIMPAILHREIKRYIQSDGVKCAYILNGYNDLYSKISKAQFIGSHYSVGITMIKKAIELGFNPIYAIGFDLSYDYPTEKERQQLTDIDEFPVSKTVKDALHAAGRIVSMKCVFLTDKPDSSHFSEDYVKGVPTQYEPPGDMMRRKFLDAIGKVDGLYNAGVGGRFDFVPRVDYDSLFE